MTYKYKYKILKIEKRNQEIISCEVDIAAILFILSYFGLFEIKLPILASYLILLVLFQSKLTKRFID
ncbi:hypothetical protein BpHYR1_025006 [Brachionus plicatilis]|uniref:Uncharacterized protein n=1 Tax=Brachionus plicatilis TaxID=10195 RepID=A0A3M7RYT7_BRAPC|nr:hypothetical protein BpHYR1_025006 [Brachionus plicatilis]